MLRIELARRTLGLPQWRLAQLARVHQGFISLIEKSQGLPDPSQTERLAAALGISPDQLLDVIPPTAAAAIPPEEGDEEPEAAEAVGQ